MNRSTNPHGYREATSSLIEGRTGRWLIALVTLAVFLFAVHSLEILIDAILRLRGYPR